MTVKPLPPRPRPRKQRREWGQKRQKEIAFIEGERIRRKGSKKWSLTTQYTEEKTGEIYTRRVFRARYDMSDKRITERAEDVVVDALQGMHDEGSWLAWVTFVDKTGVRVGSRITNPLDALRFFWATQTGMSPSAKRLTTGMVDVVGLRAGRPPPQAPRINLLSAPLPAKVKSATKRKRKPAKKKQPIRPRPGRKARRV